MRMDAKAALFGPAPELPTIPSLTTELAPKDRECFKARD